MKVPKLRFKDDDGREFPEWKINELGNLASKVNLKNRNLEINNVLTNSATQGIISQNDYFDRDIANKNNLDGYYLVQMDDFVYNPRISSNAPVGPIKRNRLIRGVMSPLYTVFRFRNGDLTFFEQFFETNYWHDYMKSMSNFGARHDRMNITNESFFALPISLPSAKEQTRIANFLTTVDEKITQLTQKCDLLAQYKKGVMQQIFSQKLRFKDDDGREFPEWEKRKSGDIAVFYNGRAYKQSEWETTGFPVIRLQNLTGSSNDYYYSNLKLPEKQYCNNGDLLFMWSATFGPVWWNGDKAIYHYHIWKIETDSAALSKNFLFYVLDEITEKTKNTSNGSTMLHITKEGIEKLVINLPSLSEQTKIAHFLTAIDGKITQAQTQLDAVKRYKKGLLQQMFV